MRIFPRAPVYEAQSLVDRLGREHRPRISREALSIRAPKRAAIGSEPHIGEHLRSSAV
jgi:hypothetical protein